jgi:hypothetical protein
MKKAFAYVVFFMFIFTLSCSNNVRSVVDDESDSDSTVETDNVATTDEDENKDDNIVPDDDTIGSECSQNDDCSTNEFCAKETGSCETSAVGTCEPKPDDCYLSRVISPVCGCDDYSYASSCWAHAEGVIVKQDGQCENDVMCWNNEACESGEYCEKKFGVCDMSSGVCRKKPNPSDCPPPGPGQPFCGCDLYEYQDICFSSSGGIPVKHEGKCDRARLALGLGLYEVAIQLS